MSHFTSVKTQIKDQAILCQTLRQLHYQYQEGERQLVRGYQGNTTYGQVVVNPGGKYDIGFLKQQDGSFDVCADWWGVGQGTQIKEASFLQTLNQEYAGNITLDLAAREGLIVEEDIRLPNGQRQIVLARAY